MSNTRTHPFYLQLPHSHQPKYRQLKFLAAHQSISKSHPIHRTASLKPMFYMLFFSLTNTILHFIITHRIIIFTQYYPYDSHLSRYQHTMHHNIYSITVPSQSITKQYLLNNSDNNHVQSF